LLKASTMKRRGGLTLVETVVSLFIITGCLLIIIKMIFSGADVQRRAGFNEKAAMIGERHLGRLRTWASDPNNFYNAALWATVAPATKSADSDHPEFTVTIQAVKQPLYSPCEQAEARFASPTEERRVLKDSYYKVQVSVAWAPVADKNQLTLVTLIGAPDHPVHHVETTTSDAGPLARDEEANLTVKALDANGNVIPDHFWSWSQQPATGVGSVGSFPALERSGATAKYKHFYRTATVSGSTQPVYGPAGNVVLTVEGRSPAIYDSASTRWTTNSTANVTVENQ
jgi:hypothetical protein